MLTVYVVLAGLWSRRCRACFLTLLFWQRAGHLEVSTHIQEFHGTLTFLQSHPRFALILRVMVRL